MDRVDVTDTITCYENGKTWKCRCGHGIGTEHDRKTVRCYGCNEAVLVDELFNEREAPEVSGQMELGAFT